MKIKNLVYKYNLYITNVTEYLSSNGDDLSLFRLSFIEYILSNVHEPSRMMIESYGSNNFMALTTGVRVLIENYANINYVLNQGKMAEHYLKKIMDNALEYNLHYEKLVASKDVKDIKKVLKYENWADQSLTKRVYSLGDVMKVKYAITSRYAHNDLWAMINIENLPKNMEFEKILMLWAAEAIDATIDLVFKMTVIPEEYTLEHEKLKNELLMINDEPEKDSNSIS